jgi:Peptidase family M1 domain/Immune inhibitor A peptidase M6/Peptidase M1 N-terminal domain
LEGVATIRARATQNLSRFDLDFVGMEVRAVSVNGHPAGWRRDGGELVVTPAAGLRSRGRFTVAVSYDGVPKTLGDPSDTFSSLGFIHTDDGMVAVGEIDSAPTWYPVNDHPSDKAAYTFRLTVPRGLEAVANGVLEGHRTVGAWSTWTWRQQEPMASYLTTVAAGRFDLRRRRAGGVRYWDAIDPDLFARTATPRTGERFAISGRGDRAYKRLGRTIDVPPSGGRVSFWVTRDAEFFDHVLVEAHTVGKDDWTTLPDLNGHTGEDAGFACPGWLAFHPSLGHYQTDNGDGTCSSSGSTGTWSSASGESDGYEHWAVDLAPYAGKRIELSISYVTDEVLTLDGVFVDDIVVSGAPGSTSFEDDGDSFDGWHVLGPPPGSGPAEDDWIAGTADQSPPTVGQVAAQAFDRQPQIVRFLQGVFGAYPFRAGGGIADDTDRFGFALETQTRPVYSRLFFDHPLTPPDTTVVHELAHQWAGDSVTIARWGDIWLNEGFATYCEWLWSEHVGRETAQELYESVVGTPADDPFWNVVIGDPGTEAMFDRPIYARGAATLHALRLRIGDADFFELLRRWVRLHAHGNAATAQFTALAERVSGRELDRFFGDWLFSGTKPAI